MADSPKLQNPIVRVVMDDGAVFEEVQTRNTDMVQYDLDRPRRKWPSGQEAPMLWLTYLAWKALLRDKAIETGMPFEVFRERAIDIGRVTDDDGAPQDESVDPTQPAVGAG
jgi:hypothetical protein